MINIIVFGADVKYVYGITISIMLMNCKVRFNLLERTLLKYNAG